MRTNHRITPHPPTPMGMMNHDLLPSNRFSKGTGMKSLRTSRIVLGFTFLSCSVFVMAGIERAQQIPESLYSEMKWRMIGPFRAGKVNAVGGVLGNTAVYYFAADGGGVWKTTDGGVVWKPIFDKEPVASMGAMTLAPSNPNIIYVGTGVNTIFADSSYGDGVYKSVDEGVTGTQIIGHGLPEGEWGRAGVAVAPGNHGRRVYVIVEAKEKKGGLYRSDDAGATWKKTTEDKRIEGLWYMSEIFVDPKNADIVYVPSQNLYRSTDGGRTFTAIKGAPGGDDYHSVWIDPTNSQRIMLGVDQGATISLDGGESWSPWYNQPTGEFYRVATDHRFPYWVYGPQQDSGTAGIVSRGNNGQITERDWVPVGPGESGYTIPDPLDAGVGYNAGPGGGGGRFSRLPGQGAGNLPAPVSFGSKFRFNWTIPMVFSPREPYLLYLGTQFLLKTVNGGTSWEAVTR